MSTTASADRATAPTDATHMAPRALDLAETLATVLPVLRADAAHIDAGAVFPERGLAALRASGLLGLLVPAEYGGLGGDLGDLVVVAGALAGECLSTAMIWAMHCQQVATVVAGAGVALREELLPRIGAGQVYLASVTSEAGKGGHLLSARAPLSVEGTRLRLRRNAPIVTGGLNADGFLITMRASVSAPPNAVSLVYGDRAALCVATRGSWDPMGMRGTHSVAIDIDGLVDSDAVLGAPGDFRTLAVRTFIPAGHIGWAACWLGAARAALAGVLHLMRSGPGRQQFDLSSELLRISLARVRLDLDATAALLRQVVDDCRAVDRGADAEDVGIQLRLNGLKVFAAEHTFAAADRLIQLVGLRHGYRRDSDLPLERLFRDLRSASLNYANDRLLLANGMLTLTDREVRLGR
jgi:acyl-CoA dehydrogenase